MIKEKITLYYTLEEFSKLGWRDLKTIDIEIFETYFILNFANGEILKITSLLDVKHVVMNGDFAKNWVKITLESGRIIYLIKKAVIVGIGGLIGGNKELYATLKKFEK